MKRTAHRFAWMLPAFLIGCGGATDVDSLLRDFDRYDSDLSGLEMSQETSRSLEAGRAKHTAATDLAARGKREDAVPVAERALADARLALERERMDAAARRADGCRLEVERARSKWEEATVGLRQVEGFAHRKVRSALTTPPSTFEVVILPVSTLDADDPGSLGAEEWDRWRNAARERAVPAADLEAAYARSRSVADDPKQAAPVAAHHAYLAGRVVQSLECRVRTAVLVDTCGDALELAAGLGDARAHVLRATLELERSLQANLRGELDQLRAAAKTRQDELFDALSQMEGKFASIRREARGTIVSLADILFDFDKATLRRNVEFNLVKIATILNQFPEMGILIEGHTDSIGSEEYNLDLSRRRAKAVFDFLVTQDVKEDRLSWEGYGESRPVEDNGTDEGRQKNRRVDLVIRDAP